MSQVQVSQAAHFSLKITGLALYCVVLLWASLGLTKRQLGCFALGELCCDSVHMHRMSICKIVHYNCQYTLEWCCKL